MGHEGARPLSRTAIVVGGIYIVLGVLFLLERLGAIGLSARFVWPILLIGAGVGILLGGRRRTYEPEEDNTPPATPPPPST